MCTVCFVLQPLTFCQCLQKITSSVRDQYQTQKLLTDSILSGSDRSAAPMPPLENAKQNGLYYLSHTTHITDGYKTKILVAPCHAPCLLGVMPRGQVHNRRGGGTILSVCGSSNQQPEIKKLLTKGLFI